MYLAISFNGEMRTVSHYTMAAHSEIVVKLLEKGILEVYIYQHQRGYWERLVISNSEDPRFQRCISVYPEEQRKRISQQIDEILKQYILDNLKCYYKDFYDRLLFVKYLVDTKKINETPEPQYKLTSHFFKLQYFKPQEISRLRFTKWLVQKGILRR